MEVFTLIMLLFSPLRFADSLFNEGDYFNAITEYKRAIYLNDSINYALFMIGLSYEKRGKYDFAARYFGSVVYNTIQKEAVYHLAGDLIRLRKYNQALIVLSGQNDSISKTLYAVALGLSGNFRKADSVLGHLGIFIQKYPPDAWLKYPSYILPGFGFLLLKEYKRAALSFLFTTASGYLTYYLFKNKRYPEGMVVLNTLFVRFYFGGVQNTVALKRQKIKSHYKALLQKIINKMSSR